LLPNDDLLGRVDSVNPEHILGDFHTDRCNCTATAPDLIGGAEWMAHATYHLAAARLDEAVASRCIAWPNAKSAVRKNQLSPPWDTIALAALAATA
jgi:hypothetical protein